jgi:hypothetical protein
MEPNNMPTFMFVPGQNADEGKKILINLNAVRQVEIEDNLLRLFFSETHILHIKGGAVTDMLGFFGMHCVTTLGTPLPESLAP